MQTFECYFEEKKFELQTFDSSKNHTKAFHLSGLFSKGNLRGTRNLSHFKEVPLIQGLT